MPDSGSWEHAEVLRTGSVAVRRARTEDVEGLLALYRELADTRADAAPADRAEAPSLLEVALADPRRSLLVAELGGGLVGTADLLFVPNLTHGGRPWGIVENVVVTARARRRGVASALFQRMEELALEAGCYKLQLLSGSQRGGAHAFYRAAGFEAVAQGFKRYLKEKGTDPALSRR
jgi:GNAT superfamily N-acetyltransferase